MRKFFLSFKTNNDRYVTADESIGGQLIPAKGEIGPWDKYVFSGNYPIRHGDVISLVANNGRYVTADETFGGKLIANKDAVGPWEKFKIIHSDNSGGEIGHGHVITLMANNGRYVTADENIGQIITAKGEIGPWDKFKIEFEEIPRNSWPPIKASRHANVSVGKMDLTVTLQADGQVISEVHARTGNNLQGFTGGFFAFFVDNAGNPFEMTESRKIGVTPHTPFSDGHDRRETYRENLGSSVYERTAKIQIVLEHDREVRWTDAEKLIQMGKDIAEIYAKFTAG